MSAARLPIEMSLDEFFARPERQDGLREELIEGELVVSPDPKFKHAYVAELLRDALQPLREQGYVVTNNTSCVLAPRSMPSPDLLVVRMERARQALDTDDWIQGSPELVIEVNSGSNQRLQQKADLYVRYGAEQVWTVYPKRQSVLVSTAEGAQEARVGESIEFHGVRIPVADIFREI